MVKTQLVDGGYSGGTLECPALKGLLADLRARSVQVVVVYMLDRLSRSISDFGRLMLNMLLSFAQLECEVTGQYKRHKIAASKKNHVDGRDAALSLTI